jgi:hypothetical protein
MIIVGRHYLKIPTELVFDHVEKVQSKLATAQDYADSDKYWSPDEVFDNIALLPLAKAFSFRNVQALQVADFWAWEFRKNHLNMKDWWASEDRPKEYSDEQWENMVGWVEDRFGSFEDATRRSLQEMLKRIPRHEAIIWDYAQLCNAHRLRGGVWA